MARTHDTIAALATPAGTSALAVIRVSGGGTLALIDGIFGAPLAPRQARHLDYRDLSGTLLDDVVAVAFAAPASYTGEDALELSCHGNPFIAQKILEDLFARGCRPAEPGEFTQRAFLSGRIDLTQAEAVMDLIHARSERALAVAQQQLRGALGRRMQGLIDSLLGTLARIEAYIDFPEEDLPGEDRRSVESALEELVHETGKLLITNHYGKILRNGIKTVIIGEPNAGKSSLLNCLVGRERAIVSPLPGTTRDFIEEPILVGSHCLRLIDTAGLNPAPESIERLGIEKTHERIEEADLFILVLDASRPLPPLPDTLWTHLRRDNALVVANKMDLAGGALSQTLPVDGLEIIQVSATLGLGIESLRTSLARLAKHFEVETGGEDIAINARHADALQRAREALASALEKLRQPGCPAELVASDLRQVLTAFGDISGKVDNERMLDHLFASFCIGK